LLTKCEQLRNCKLIKTTLNYDDDFKYISYYISITNNGDV